MIDQTAAQILHDYWRAMRANQQLAAENAALRARIAELEGQQTAEDGAAPEEPTPLEKQGGA